MKLKKLKESIKDIPDDYEVLVNIETEDRGYLKGSVCGVYYNEKRKEIKLTSRR